MGDKRTCFGWKKKSGDKVSTATATQFEKEASKDSSSDWPLPKRLCISLEDAAAKSQRLKQEGIILAEAGRNWEAVKKWDEALTFTPDNETLHEMKAQVFLDLHEVVQAVQSAQKAVNIQPTWWIGHQTLGRAHLSVGDVQLAKLSFCRAIILNPSERELWDEDLSWTLSLLARKREMDLLLQNKVNENKTMVTEITDCAQEEIQQGQEDFNEGQQGQEGHIQEDPENEANQEKLLDIYSANNQWKQCPNMNRLPHNYVLMR